MKNLFLNLEKYSGKEGRTPHEEYFTQLVSFVLNEDIELRKKFIEYVTKDKISPSVYEKIDSENGLLEPEYCVNNVGELDILIEIKNKLMIVIESKLGARAGKSKKSQHDKEVDEREIEKEQDAIHKYLNWLYERKHTDKFFVLITHPYNKYISIAQQLDERSHKSNIKFNHIAWKQFHRLLSDFCKSSEFNDNQKNGFLIKQLKEYMEDENMKSWSSLKKEDGARISNLWETYNDITILLDKISEIFLKQLAEENPTLNKDSEEGLSEIDEASPYSICKYITIKTILIHGMHGMWFGFKGNNNENKSEFSFFIELEFVSKKSLKPYEFILKEKGYTFEKDSVYPRKEYKFDDSFFSCNAEKQIEKLESFIKGVIQEIKSMKSV